jgi:biopolymer transport protein ExbD
MIDVVFQLVIFLMLANDLTRRDLVDLELAGAPHSREDGQAPGRVTVNLLAGPTGAPPAIRIRGEAVDLEGLRRALAAARTGEEPPGILLRADRRTPWLHVQAVLQACAGRGVEVHRVEFATTDGTPGPVAGRGGAR